MHELGAIGLVTGVTLQTLQPASARHSVFTSHTLFVQAGRAVNEQTLEPVADWKRSRTRTHF